MKHQDWQLTLVMLAAGFLLGAGQAQSRKPDSFDNPEFDRAQFMLMNLNRGKDSAGWYFQESSRQARIVSQQLDKALRQLEQVEKAFAKSRGRPDDKFLPGVEGQIEQAKLSAAKLEEQCRNAEKELKSSIQQVLLMEGK